MSNFFNTLLGNSIFMIFLTLTLGYLFGRISFGGLKFGTSGVLVVALIFGHFGMTVPGILGSVGLVLFLSAVGLSAGPSFVSNLKANFWGFIATSASILVAGGVVIILCVKYFGIPADLALGIAAGALTSTTSLAATVELTSSTTASVGYGLAYVFGIISIVFFVQLVPKFLKADIEKENEKLIDPPLSQRLADLKNMKLIVIDGPGVYTMALSIILGVALGAVKIPMGTGTFFSLGNAGGTIIAGIIVSAFGRIGKISLQAPKTTLMPVRDLGISLFLLQNGTKAGAGFIETLSQYGVKLFVAGVVMSLAAIFAAYIVSKWIFRMPLFAALGATTGAMTSAPALNALISVSNDDRVAAFYAACQPVATVGLVILPQVILAILS